MKEGKWVELYADGSYLPKHDVGGWAVLLRYKGKERLITGANHVTTNNRMEMLAIIKGLEALTRSCNVTVHTDSQYVQQGMTKWLSTWLKNDFTTSKNKLVKNKDMWLLLAELDKKHTIIWNWIKGHNGNPLHDRVDVASREEANRLVK